MHSIVRPLPLSAGPRVRPMFGLIFLLAAIAALSAYGGVAPPAPAALLLLGGLLCGVLSGLLGIGGALISVPTLYLALPAMGVAAPQLPHAVLAAALLAMLPTTLAIGCAHARRRALDLAWLARLGPGMALGALLGALLATQLGGIVLQSTFAAQSLVFGLSMLCRPAPPPRPASPGASRLPPWVAGPGAAAFGGCVGMGVGSLIVPYLERRGVDLRPAVATSATLNVCIAFGGSLAFWAHAQAAAPLPAAVWPAAVLLGAAATLAVPFGVACSGRLRSDRLRRGVGAINVAGAISLLANAL